MDRRSFLILAGAILGGSLFGNPATKGLAQEIEDDEGQGEPQDTSNPENIGPDHQPASEPSIRALIDLETQTLTLYEEQTGQLTATRFPCVVGRRNRRGASVTPPGLYAVAYKSASDHALHGRFGAVYGRRFIGLRNLRKSARNIGIHGTYDPEKLEREDRYFSLGCIRLDNETIEDRVYPAIQSGDRIGIVERVTPELERAIADAYFSPYPLP